MKASMSEQLAGKLDSDARHIAITTDIWTSLSNEAYLSFTASYVDHDWTIKSSVLATINLEDRHTQSVIAENIGKVAQEWNVATKVIACVHDGTANIRDVGDRNNWLDVSCAAHKLQLCINTSMGTDKVTDHPIAKCVTAAAGLPDAFHLTATTSLPLR